MQTVTDDTTGLITAKNASTFKEKCVPKIMADKSIIPAFVSGNDIVRAVNYFKHLIERKDGIDNDHLLNLFLLENASKQFNDSSIGVDIETYDWMKSNWDAYLSYMNDFNRELSIVNKRMILYLYDCQPTIDAHDGTYIKAALRASISTNRRELQNIRIKTFLTDAQMECRYIFAFTGHQQVIDTSLTIKE